MKRIIATILAVSIMPLCFGQKLVILHTNDTHSHLETIRGTSNGGVIERAAYIEKVRAEVGAENVLLIDGGDISQGTPYFSIGKGVYEDAAIHAMGYDCVTIGNHEFDNGTAALIERYSHYKIPVVCANLDLKDTPLAKYVKPYTIIKRGGLKIGIIGLAPHLEGVVDSSKAPNIVNLPSIDVVNQYAKILKKRRHCDLVIVLSHLGYNEINNHNSPESDTFVAANTVNVDIIVGGHTHSNLKTEKYVTNPEGKEVMIVQDYCFGEYVGAIEVKYE